jgi:hypothetical protein
MSFRKAVTATAGARSTSLQSSRVSAASNSSGAFSSRSSSTFMSGESRGSPGSRSVGGGSVGDGGGGGGAVRSDTADRNRIPTATLSRNALLVRLDAAAHGGDEGGGRWDESTTSSSSLGRHTSNGGGDGDRRSPHARVSCGSTSSTSSSSGGGTTSNSNSTPTLNNAHAAISRRSDCPAVGPTVGLSNLGNTCFMNSVLQCLAHTPALVHAIQSNPSAADRLVESFKSLLQTLHQRDRSAVAPNHFKKEIGARAPYFAGYQQHDAQEFLRYLVDGLHEGTNRVRVKVGGWVFCCCVFVLVCVCLCVYVCVCVCVCVRGGGRVRVSKGAHRSCCSNHFLEKRFSHHQVPYCELKYPTGATSRERARIATEWYRARHDSPIADVFQGQLRSTLRCNHCKYRSLSFEPFWDLVSSCCSCMRSLR